MKRVLNELLDVLFPRVCTVCHKALVQGEDVMCLGCLAELPLTNQHLRQPNDIHERLVTLHTPVKRCASMFYYHKENPYSRLILAAKYHNRPSVGRKLAEMFSADLCSKGFFDGIDLIIPVPIHFTKLLTRGYNQTLYIAKGISKVSGIAVGENLRANRPHTSQTHKGSEARRANSTGIFSVLRPSELDGLHILLVDDVITTGSTMVSALNTLHAVNPTICLSVLSLALTNS